MLFKRKFFLDLEADSGQPPATIAVVAPPASPEPEAAPAVAAPAAKPTVAAAPAAAVAAPSAPKPTTAESIAAELAAELASRPAPTQATFAPECLTPGAAQLRRRKAGADLAGFRSMAGSLLSS